MLQILARHWYLLVIRGVLAILFALAAFFWPEQTFSVLVVLVGAFVFADGILSVIQAFQLQGQDDKWWIPLLEGLLGISFGVITFFKTDLTIAVLLGFVAAWAILTGLLEIILAIRLRKEIQGEVFMAIMGVLGILFGIFILAWPESGLRVLSYYIGFYALLFGILLVAVGLRLRKLKSVSASPHSIE